METFQRGKFSVPIGGGGGVGIIANVPSRGFSVFFDHGEKFCSMATKSIYELSGLINLF